MHGAQTKHEVRSAWAIASIIALMLAVSGCRSHRTDPAPSQAANPTERVDTPQASAEKVASAGVAIVSECAKVSFDNASEGLIVAAPGLHEDVFDLRDRLSYRTVPFRLDEALRLEALLRKESSPQGRLPSSPQQTACIDQFVAQLQSLTDPLVEADAEQKQLDVSAFDKASREAEQETERQTEQEQKAMQPASSSQQ